MRQSGFRFPQDAGVEPSTPPPTVLATPILLTRTGFVHARLSVLDGKGAVIDKPDSREQMLRKSQRIGFGWICWFTETKW